MRDSQTKHQSDVEVPESDTTSGLSVSIQDVRHPFASPRPLHPTNARHPWLTGLVRSAFHPQTSVSCPLGPLACLIMSSSAYSPS